MKKSYNAIKEYVKKLSDDEVRLLYDRFSQNLNGDLNDITDLVQKNPEMDRLLSQTDSVDDFFCIIDSISAIVQSEIKKKSKRFDSEA